MIMQDKSFQIKKIVKADGFWKLYPKLKGVDPILLDVNKVYGELPVRWKWPWQSYKLSIKCYDDFIFYAEMDGRILFSISEDDFPEEIKKELSRMRAIERTSKELMQKYDETIKQQLAEFLPKVEPIACIEDKIPQLSICWRLFFKMRLSSVYQEDKEQEIFLLYRLADIVQRIYQRHVDDDAPLSVVFAYHDVALKSLPDTGYDGVCIEIMEKDSEYDKQDAYSLYREVKRDLLRIFPGIPRPLEYYLNFLVRDMLVRYADDYATLVCKRPRDLFGDTINTDNEAYGYLATEMKLPKFSSFIFNRAYTDEEIKKAGLGF